MFENVILENETIEDAEFVGCEFKKWYLFGLIFNLEE